MPTSVRAALTAATVMCAFLCAACGDPPEKEMHQAQGAIAAARAAGADEYAAEEMNAAVDALRRAEAAAAERDRQPIGFQWAARCLGEVLGPDTIVVNEYPLDLRHAPPAGPGSYFGAPHSGGLGWGLGTALGIKLGAPGATVIATVGDGAYIFGAPTAAHYAARLHGLPILTVIFNNGAWEAVKTAALQVHPDGWAASTQSFPLSGLAPTPRYEEIVRAFDGHGERVETPDALPGALRRALKVVREERRQAVINVVCQR